MQWWEYLLIGLGSLVGLWLFWVAVIFVYTAVVLKFFGKWMDL